MHCTVHLQYIVNLISIVYFSEVYYFSEIYRTYLPSFSFVGFYIIFRRNIRINYEAAQNLRFTHGCLVLENSVFVIFYFCANFVNLFFAAVQLL